MKSSEKIFLSWIGLLNTIAACLVVYIHTYNAYSYSLTYDGENSKTYILYFEDFISQDLAHIAVPLFFFISGFLFFRTLSYSTIKEKLFRRIRTLCIPYLLWNFIYFVLFYFVSHIPFLSENTNSINTVQFNLLTVVTSIFFYKYNYIMWFVYQLIIYTFVLGPIIQLLLKRTFIALSIILCCAIVYSLDIMEIPNLSQDTVAIGIYPDMLAYFILGGVSSKYKLLPKRNGIIFGAISIICGQFIWLYNYSGFKHWNYNILNFAFCFLSIIGIYYIFSSLKKEFSKIQITKYNFFIFLIHPFLLECIQKIFYITLPHNEFSALSDYLISPVITIAICILSGYLLDKHIHNVYNLLGGR